MKSFFKKIALVLVLAMVVTMLPARVASAADSDGPQMYGTLKFYLGGDETGKYSDESRYAVTWNKKGYNVVDQFVSSDPEVATVNGRGYVTPHKVGTATITATFKSTTGGADVVRTCKVTVKKNATEAGISGNSAKHLEDGIAIGEKYLVKTYRKDADITSWKGKDVFTSAARFESSDKNVFTVTKTGGTVVGVGNGTATLKVWAVQSEGAKKENGKVVDYLAVTEPKEYQVKVGTGINPPPAVQGDDRARLSAADARLVADGVSGTLITFTLYADDNTIDDKTKDVQVRLESTRGTLAMERVTLEHGRATVLYTTPIMNVESVARITATIISAENTPVGQSLINIQATPIDIALEPFTGAGSGTSAEVVTGANVLSSVVVTADRVTVFFNKSVKADEFMYLKDGKYVVNDGDKYKFSLEVDDNIPQTQTTVLTADFTEKDIINIVQNTDTSLDFILRDDKGKVFTDNSRYALNFVDSRYAGVVSTPNVIGYVTDAFKPSMLRVDQEGGNSLTQVTVTFSEPIPNFDATHVVIDGVALDGQYAQDRWGVAGRRATVARLGSVENNNRNIYIITLGKNALGKQIYFTPGLHSLTVNNVGDYASWTDAAGNTITTATLDFNVVANDIVPDYTVEVQSPEQYVVNFNCQVEPTDAVDWKSVLKLEYRTDSNQWVDVEEGLGQLYDVVGLGNRDGKSRVLVEVKSDWTEILGSRDYQNYYNYRFQISAEKDAITNVANGKTNVAISRELTDSKMKTVDSVSPEFVGEVDEVTTGSEFTISFSEPIQLTGDGKTGLLHNGNAGNITPSTAQKVNGGGVPIITAQVVAADLSKTVDAEIVEIDRENYTIKIRTSSVLTPGTDYVLYVRSVSDDIGNTSLTLSKKFRTSGTVTPADTRFLIAGVWADAALDDELGIYDLTEVADDKAGAWDAIYVEFTNPIAVAGGVKTVLTNTNWSINGYPLPAGSYIVGNIIGDSRLNGVTIILPNGTITNIHTTVVTLSKHVEDIYGNTLFGTLTGTNRVVTQYPETVKHWGMNQSLVNNSSYVGKIGKFAAANPKNIVDFTVVGATPVVAPASDSATVATPSAITITSTGASVKVVINEIAHMTVSGKPNEVLPPDVDKDSLLVTSEQVKINDKFVDVVKGYRIVLYGVVEDKNKKVTRLDGKEVDATALTAALEAVFDIRNMKADTYDYFRVELTALGTNGCVDSAPCYKDVSIK